MLDNPTLKTIRQRRSTRAFTPEQISEDALRAILEAGTYAPNAGDQAWHFTAVQNPDLLEQLNRAAKETAIQFEIPGLADLAQNPEFHVFYGAPTLVIVSSDESFSIPLDADCAAAMENMLLAAESLGLGSCWVFFVTLAFAGSEGPALREELRIPTGFKPTYAAAIGIPSGEKPEASERKSDRITVIR